VGDLPDRYRRFAETYTKLVKDRQRLMFDINVVTDRESGLAPTKLPAGTELALTAFSAAQAGNGRVAIYSESSLLRRTVAFAVRSWKCGGAFTKTTGDNGSEGRGRRTGDRARGSGGGTHRDGKNGPAFSVMNPGGTPLLGLPVMLPGQLQNGAPAGKHAAGRQRTVAVRQEGEVLIPIGEHTLGSAKLERGLIDRFGLGYGKRCHG